MTRTPEEFDQRTDDLLALEAAAPQEGLWWLSFVDPALSAPRDEQKPGGPGFLGVVIVHAIGPMHAVMRSHALGVNPGGEVAMHGPYTLDSWAEQYRDRLIPREEVLSW